MANNGIPCDTDLFPQEIKLLLEKLHVEREELDVQINEKRAQLSFVRKDIGNEEENLQGVLGQVTKHKMGMSLALLDSILCRLERNTLSFCLYITAVFCCSLLLNHCDSHSSHSAGRCPFLKPHPAWCLGWEFFMPEKPEQIYCQG